jgi:hypothetical protein
MAKVSEGYYSWLVEICDYLPSTDEYLLLIHRTNGIQPNDGLLKVLRSTEPIDDCSGGRSEGRRSGKYESIRLQLD